MLASFLGCLLAVAMTIAAVYTYATLVFFPRIARASAGTFAGRPDLERAAEEHGQAIVAELSGSGDGRIAVPGSVVRPPVTAQDLRPRASDLEAPHAFGGIVRFSFMCTQHGNCGGCAEVRAQFETAARMRGLDPLEVEALERLRHAFPSSTQPIEVQ